MYKKLHLVEHSNCITDIFLAIVLSVLALQLQPISIQNSFVKSWEVYFSLMAIATLIGGFGHLFSYHLDKNMLIVSWLLVIWATFYLEINMIKTVFQSTQINSLLFIKSLALTFLTLKKRNFFPTTIALIIGLAGIVCFSLLKSFFDKQNYAYLIIAFSILSGSLAGLVRAKQINLASWFDANDLAHLISAGSFMGAYLGVKGI